MHHTWYTRVYTDAVGRKINIANEVEFTLRKFRCPSAKNNKPRRSPEVNQRSRGRKYEGNGLLIKAIVHRGQYAIVRVVYLTNISSLARGNTWRRFKRVNNSNIL